MYQVAEQTHDQKVEMYLKLPKEQLINMLIACNNFINALKPKVSTHLSDQGDVWREIQVEERRPVKDDNYFVFTALHSGGHTFRKGRRAFFKNGCFKIDNAPGDEYVTSWLEKKPAPKTEDEEVK